MADKTLTTKTYWAVFENGKIPVWGEDGWKAVNLYIKKSDAVWHGAPARDVRKVKIVEVK